jgi:hypothetical protein
MMAQKRISLDIQEKKKILDQLEEKTRELE